MKLVVYTAIFGDYDDLIEIPRPKLNINYICFTDNDKLRSNTWDIRYKPLDIDPCRSARLIKICPHRFLPGKYDYSVWIDGNMTLNRMPEVLSLLNGSALMASVHPTRNCVYKEASICKALKKDDWAIINEQMHFYKDVIKFPKNVGLWETGILIRKHNDRELVFLNEVWWDIVKLYSKRDQLSFPVVFSDYDFVSFERMTQYQIVHPKRHKYED